MLPSRDRIGTASAATTITETDYDNYQRLMDVVLKKLQSNIKFIFSLVCVLY